MLSQWFVELVPFVAQKDRLDHRAVECSPVPLESCAHKPCDRFLGVYTQRVNRKLVSRHDEAGVILHRLVLVAEQQFVLNDGMRRTFGDISQVVRGTDDDRGQPGLNSVFDGHLIDEPLC